MHKRSPSGNLHLHKIKLMLKAQERHGKIAFDIFGNDVRIKHSILGNFEETIDNVFFSVELIDGSVWLPAPDNLEAAAPTYQCIRLPEFLQPQKPVNIFVSNGKHPSIQAYSSDYASALSILEQ